MEAGSKLDKSGADRKFSDIELKKNKEMELSKKKEMTAGQMEKHHLDSVDKKSNRRMMKKPMANRGKSLDDAFKKFR